jgi:hypothetical protein
MAVERNWRSTSVLFVAVLGLAEAPTSHADGQGNASFQGKGDVKDYKTGLVVWSGGFVGVSVVDGKKGPLHNSGPARTKL